MIFYTQSSAYMGIIWNACGLFVYIYFHKGFFFMYITDAGFVVFQGMFSAEDFRWAVGLPMARLHSK